MLHRTRRGAATAWVGLARGPVRWPSGRHRHREADRGVPVGEVGDVLIGEVLRHHGHHLVLAAAGAVVTRACAVAPTAASTRRGSVTVVPSQTLALARPNGYSAPVQSPRAAPRSLRLAVRTSPSHGENRGSIPLGSANHFNWLEPICAVCAPPCGKFCGKGAAERRRLLTACLSGIAFAICRLSRPTQP
jgi:hypothetical protein